METDTTAPQAERELQLFIANAFISDSARSLQQGNPAAVVLLPPSTPGLPLRDDLMQAIAAQLNLSETAFVEWDPPAAGVDATERAPFRIRWFTPTCEVDLCGHATMAAAVALLEEKVVSGDETVQLKTRRKGTLQVVFEKRPNLGRLETFAKMTFPAIHALRPASDADRAAVLRALRVPQARQVLHTEFDIAVVLRDPADVARIAPDMALLRRIDTRGVIVCAQVGSSANRASAMRDDVAVVRDDVAVVRDDVAVVSRFFAPAAGIDEDPVTGSAHCVLAPLFLPPGGRCACAQLSRRGGTVEVARRGTDRVEIGGAARVVSIGCLYA